VADHLDLTQWGVRVDFLATYAAEHVDGARIAKELESMLGCQVRKHKDKQIIVKIKNCLYYL
jgi:hypothetical protein